MGKKWMVYDDSSEDKIFYDTLEEAEKDYKDAVSDIENNKYIGEHNIYLFEVKQQKKLTFYP
ncbi:hypothetical protein [Evansella clarkii]|uniref:hypothetical protein n=1 Tax=Evansella clarkii TaxID=79879 RepID=UPI000998C508|nr:hypothetical protein [Evansella clarkii]